MNDQSIAKQVPEQTEQEETMYVSIKVDARYLATVKVPAGLSKQEKIERACADAKSCFESAEPMPEGFECVDADVIMIENEAGDFLYEK